MIASVRGRVTARRPDHVVIEAAGVGYRLSVSGHTLRQVPAAGVEALLHSHLVMRDDGLHLYGFASEEERDLFLMLVTIQGVGPKVALAVLSGGSPGDLVRALAAGDAAFFQAAPGVGKRTAERIVAELRDKVAPPAVDAAAVAPARAPSEPDVVARDALLGLGFSAQEAERLLAAAQGETPEELVADALRSAR